MIEAIVDDSIAKLEPEQRREWAELHAEHGYAADGCDTISRWTPEHRKAIELALRVYAVEQADAREVLGQITKWSRRLGVWLACRVAREALRHVPLGEQRPLRAIETAERWVRGEATEDECLDASAANIAANAATAAAYAANAASYAASDAAEHAAAYAAHAADYTASAYAASYAASPAGAMTHDADLRSLCVLISSEIERSFDVMGGAD